ncbi:MAG: T9SS type A sorting domain-containing protein [Candidatus Krumholzibacteriota bacterium]|nr:T9SS type A sorting domain-containing protein [Candidatus Krumholzibacteriota bacterium]
MKLQFTGMMLLAVVMAMITIGSNAAAQSNLLANPGFEALGGSYDGWFTFGAGVQLSTPDTDNIIRTDSTASKIYGEFTGCPTPMFDVGGFGQAFTPVPGMIYQFNGYSYVSSDDQIPGTDPCSSNRLLAKIVFFNAAEGGAELSSNEMIIGDGNSILDTWNEFSVEAPCPSGALRVEALFLFLQPGCDTGSVFIDDVSFYEFTPPTPAANLLANPSFDTGITGWTKFGNVYADSRAFALRTRPASAKLYGPFANPGDASGIYQSFAVTEGTELELSLYAMTTCVESPISGSNDNFGTMKLIYFYEFQHKVTVVDSVETVIVDNTSPLGTWTYHSESLTAPAGCDSVAVYILFIQPTDMGGAFWIDDVSLCEVTTTGADEQIPTASTLYQNVPNPFNPTTRIDFNLAVPGQVEIKVYNVTGSHVATIFSGYKEAGLHTVVWNGKSADGNIVASGVYYYSLVSGDEKITRKMVLLR